MSNSSLINVETHVSQEFSVNHAYQGGVNISSGNVGYYPGELNTNYNYGTNQDIDYFTSKGLSNFRISFSMGHIIEAGSEDDIHQIKALVQHASAVGASVILDVHDYGYNPDGSLIGSTADSVKEFSDNWSKIATIFAKDNNVIFGLMNEPHEQSANQWLEAANSAINAIRSTGAKQEILVPGSYWDGASSWISSGNGPVFANSIIDTQNNYAIDLHQYLDIGSAGVSSSVVKGSGASSLVDVTEWARQTEHKLFLSEFGFSQDTDSLKEGSDLVKYMKSNSDVWQGSTYWAAGDWWDDYIFSVQPKGLGTAQVIDKPQLAVITGNDGSNNHPDSNVGHPSHINPTLSSIGNGHSSLANITLGGVAEANSIVSVYMDGAKAPLGTATATDSGAWWYWTPSALSSGTHSFDVRSTSSDGHISDFSAAQSVSIDLPQSSHVNPTLSSIGNGHSSLANITLGGVAEANSVVSIYMDGAKAPLGTATATDSGAWWYWTPSALSSGTHSFDVRSTSSDGHISDFSAAQSVSIDLPQPSHVNPTLSSIENGHSSLANITLGGIAEANSVVSIYMDGAKAPLGTATATDSGAWWYWTPSALSSGTHSFDVRSTSSDGHISDFSNVQLVSIDTPQIGSVIAMNEIISPIYGDSSADTFVFAPLSNYNSPIQIENYSYIKGDRLDLSLLQTDGGDHLRLSELKSGDSANLQIHHGSEWSNLALVKGLHLGDEVTVLTGSNHDILHLYSGLL